MTRTIRLRFAGTCAGCSADLAKGATAEHDPDTRAVTCPACIGGTDGPAGASAATEAAHASAQAEDLERRAARAARRAAAFAAGATGERLCAEALAPLAASGHIVLHDRAAGDGANLDHVVVGPSGVWLVNAKHWTGELEVSDTLRRDGRSCAKQVRRAAEERRRVSATLEGHVDDVTVRNAFVFTGESTTTGEVDDVLMLSSDTVADTIRRSPQVWSAADVDRAAIAVINAFPAASERPRVVPGDDADLPDDLGQDTNYIFVTPWRKSGRHRLYVHRDGRQFGWVDVASGKLHPEVEDDRADGTLRLALEHAVTEPADYPDRGRLARLARWYLTGGLSEQRRVLAVRWRRRSADRLYVHLVTGVAGKGSREQLGHVDLTTGTVHAAADEHAAVVARAGALLAANSR